MSVVIWSTNRKNVEFNRTTTLWRRFPLASLKLTGKNPENRPKRPNWKFKKKQPSVFMGFGCQFFWVFSGHTSELLPHLAIRRFLQLGWVPGCPKETCMGTWGCCSFPRQIVEYLTTEKLPLKTLQFSFNLLHFGG